MQKIEFASQFQIHTKFICLFPRLLANTRLENSLPYYIIYH